MMTNEELRERIEREFSLPAGLAIRVYDFAREVRTETERAMAEDALDETRSLDWHRVEDVTMPLDVDVLCWAPGSERLRLGRRDMFGTIIFSHGLVTEVNAVTHWALPTLPDGTVPRG